MQLPGGGGGQIVLQFTFENINPCYSMRREQIEDEDLQDRLSVPRVTSNFEASLVSKGFANVNPNIKEQIENPLSK